MSLSTVFDNDSHVSVYKKEHYVLEDCTMYNEQCKEIADGEHTLIYSVQCTYSVK